MSSIKLHREHELDQQESRELAEKLLNKLVDKYGGKYQEDGDNFRYKHTAGVKALVEPLEGEFLVDIKLGLMTLALGPKLEGDINKILDKYL